MTKILFVCHGNICRSPTAEFILRDMVKKLGPRIFVLDEATSSVDTITEQKLQQAIETVMLRKYTRK